MEERLSVLRAGARVLARGGMMAGYVIRVGPSPDAEKRLAPDDLGPPHARRDDDLLGLMREAGFDEVAEEDATADYRETMAAWLHHRARLADRLSALLGEDEVAALLERLRGALRAIDDGLLRRSLFVGRRSAV